MSAERRTGREALLERLQNRIPVDREEDIPRRPDRERAPLSHGQELLWLLDQATPGLTAYNVPRALRLRGPLDTAGLLRALDRLVSRHEALRTVFLVDRGEPLQQVIPPRPVLVAFHDFGHMTEAARRGAVDELIGHSTRRPFDLGRDLLLRGALARLGQDDHALVLVTHHIVSDGWSKGVLFTDLAALYGAEAGDTSAELADLPIQYGDFAAWQRSEAERRRLDQLEGYWLARLEGAPPLLELPVDRARPARHAFEGATRRRQLPSTLREAVAALGRRTETTPFMVLLAGFTALLHRYTAQEDVVLGSPISGRNRPETEGLIGFFLNTLVLRTAVEEGLPFVDLLARVRETCLGAYEHQDLPFSTLAGDLRGARGSTSPLFNVIFVAQQPDGEVPRFGAVFAEPIELDVGAALTDLAVSVEEGPRGIEVVAQYRTDLFDAATVDRLLSHYERLLEAACLGPDRAVGTLPLLDPAEHHAIVAAARGERYAYPDNRCVHEQIAEQSARQPNAPAVTSGDRTLTYGELLAASDRLSAVLREMGVAPETTVGLCVDRSVDLAVGILGILRAGGAYVPLDPSYPTDRLAFMAEDAGLGPVVTVHRCRDRVPAGITRVIVLEELPEAAGVGVAPRVTPENLAYVIYTSGSTGRPKGVAVTHANLLHSTYARDRFFGEAPGRYLLLSSYSFDSSVAGIFWTLCRGGTLVIPPEGTQLDVPALCGLIRRERVTHLLQLPSVYGLLLSEGDPSALASLRTVIVAGEACPEPLLQHHRAVLPHATFVNEYGPTEATVWCSGFSLGPDEPVRRVTIGRPISNTEIYVLDPRGGLAPVGVPGELVVGGPGLARGYLNRADLTAERFVTADPAGDGPRRLYRTGDRVRLLPLGELEFSGRIDDQVKVRGYRVELGEIETAVASLPGIRGCAVLLREDLPGDSRLVAYVVPDPGADADLQRLRAGLRGVLPDFMLPSAVVVLAHLPLTPNGKIDRHRLPAPVVAAPVGTTEAPASPLERTVAGILSAVLTREGIGRRDNFFDVGGHSLLAMRAMARINREFGVRLSWAAIFESPTVADLARVVGEAAASGNGQAGLTGPAVRPVGAAVPLTWAQELLWLLDRTVPDLAAYNVPLLLRLTGALDTEALRQALDAIVSRHEALRTSFVLSEGARDPEQRVGPPQPVPLELCDLRRTPAPERAAAADRIIAEHMRRRFDLGVDLLLRATLLRHGDEEHQLLVMTHHVVFDEWSSGVLQRELGALYSAFRRGTQPKVATLPVQYGDYAIWQRAALAGGVLTDQLDYWRDRLRSAPTLDLSTDYPRSGLPAFEGARVRFRWDADLLAGLKQLGRGGDATLYMTVLAGYVALLHRYTGQDDIVVGSPVSSRSTPELDDLIGYFPNVVALRTRFDPARSFHELLGAVREACLGSFAHQDVPIEKLALELQKDGRSGNVPLIQVNYQLVASALAPPALDGLTATAIPVDFGTAKFEIALAVRETDEGLEGTIEYRTDLFEGTTIDRLIGHLETLLRGAVGAPETAVERLPLLTARERRQVVTDWNATAVPYPADVTLTELLDRQAARTPAAEAIRFEGAALSYAELHARANQLAHRLRGLGVTTGVQVGLCAERSLELVVGLLGVLKAGGTYVPLDPEYPRERLAFMLEDAAVPVLLTQRRLLTSLPQGTAIQLCLDGEEAVNEPRTPPPLTAGAGDAAYMIYTSGSTGRPKGALNAHRGIVNRLLWMQVAFGLTGADTVLQKTPFSFDVSVWEFFWPLMTGARLVLARPGGHRDPSYLTGLINRERVTILHFVPSMLRAFLAEPTAASCRTLRDVMCSGEALPLEILRHWTQTLPARLHNLYGPTEAAVDVTWWACDVTYPRSVVPIGRPIANTTTYILDPRGEPVPVGVPGELFLGGVQVGLGYWKRPDLTAERFVADPFATGPDARLYRTGDRARYLPDGNIEFLGRLDFQVKLRGFRIELGEIEASLMQHPRIKDAAVQVHQDAAGDGLLVGYVVTEDAISLGTDVVAETVEKWAEVFDQAYAQPETAATGGEAGEFNIRGWVSSYTLSPIPAEEMQEWVERTCERIRELSPRRVLEIGCGTGLLLFRIAPECERYAGLDVSRAALDSIRATPAFAGLPQVTLAEGAADQLDGFGPGEFDTIVINSVAQYFPSAEYLVTVLEHAVPLLRPGGAIFLGDIRSLPLLETLHTSVALFQAPPTETASELRERVRYHLGQETELIVDPAFFHAFRAYSPAVAHVEIRPKFAQFRNELSKFRYDVVLRTAPVEAGAGARAGLRLAAPTGLAEVRALLADRPEELVLTGCRDRRLSRDTRLGVLLAEASDSDTAAILLAALVAEPEEGFEPDELATLDPRYAVDLLWREGSPLGTFDAVFRQRERAGVAGRYEGLDAAPRPWRDYVHHPQPDALNEADLMVLRDFLAERLPDYMVPTSFVRLPALPLGPSGKLDRKALRPPALLRRTRAMAPARTPEQRAIAAIWAEVLHLDRVGVDESFIDLGGHSLQAMRILGRIRAETGVTLTLIELLRGATVADLATAIVERLAAPTEDEDEGLVAVSREAFRRPEGSRP